MQDKTNIISEYIQRGYFAKDLFYIDNERDQVTQS